MNLKCKHQEDFDKSIFMQKIFIDSVLVASFLQFQLIDDNEIDILPVKIKKKSNE